MGECFEFHLMQKTVNRGDPSTADSRLTIAVLPDVEDELDERLFSLQGRHCGAFFAALEQGFCADGFWPWAFVFFHSEFGLAGHVRSISQGKGNIAFTALSLKPGDAPRVPPVSILMARSKRAMHDAALISPLFAAPWCDLADKDDGRHWICIANQPPDEWVRMTSQGDDQLFLELTES